MEGEFEDEPRIGGHNFAFVDELSTGQTCSICLLAMRSPVQTVCGHRFCESCLLEAFRYCIVCRTVYLMKSSTCISYCVFLPLLDVINTKMSAAKVERAKYSKLIMTEFMKTASVIALIHPYFTLISQLPKSASKSKRERK